MSTRLKRNIRRYRLRRRNLKRHLRPEALYIVGGSLVGGAFTGASLGGPVGIVIGSLAGIGAAAVTNHGRWLEDDVSAGARKKRHADASIHAAAGRH